MPDNDKILEAEQSIQKIAAELKRMRDAANLLQESQETKDAVLRAAENVIKHTSEFSGLCGEIIKALSAADLNQRLAGIVLRINRVYGLVDEHAKKTNGAIAATESRIAALEDTLKLVDEHAKKTNRAIAATESRIAALEDTLQAVAIGAAKRHMISMVLIILTLASSLAALVVMLSRAIGM